MTASPLLVTLLNTVLVGTTSLGLLTNASAAPTTPEKPAAPVLFSLPGLNGVDVAPAERPSPDLTQEDEALAPESDDAITEVLLAVDPETPEDATETSSTKNAPADLKVVTFEKAPKAKSSKAKPQTDESPDVAPSAGDDAIVQPPAEEATPETPDALDTTDSAKVTAPADEPAPAPESSAAEPSAADPAPEPTSVENQPKVEPAVTDAPTPDTKSPEASATSKEKPSEVKVEGDSTPLALTEPEKSSDEPAPAPAYVEPYPPSVLTLFGVTPYVSTQAEMAARFGGDLQSASDTLVNTDQVHDPDIRLGETAADHLLISYTEKGTVSDLFLTFDGLTHDEALGLLKTQLAQLDPEGYWKTTPEGDVWRNAQTEVVLLAERASLVFGAVARHARETSAWMREHPDALPHFAGIVVGETTQEAVPELLKPTCQRFPFMGRDGTRFIRLEGACFGVPGETESTLRFDENGQKVVELSIHFTPNKTTSKALARALKKRFTYSDEAAVFHSWVSPAKNVWVPTAELESDRLSFRVYSDGVKAAHEAWEAELTKKRQAEAELKRVESELDALFK